MSLLNREEPIVVETSPVACDGGGGPLGHPKVYLPLKADGTGECPYCGRQFVLAAGARSAGH